MEFDERVKEIKKKTHQTSIHISRIPKQTKTEFMELAEKEFLGDYGFLIKELMEFRKGILTTPNVELEAKIDLLAEEINKIKIQIQTPVVEEEKGITMVSGKKLKRRNENEQVSTTSRKRKNI